MGSPISQRRWPKRLRLFAPVALLCFLLTNCGGGGGAQIQWIEGTAPPELIAQINAGIESTATSEPVPTVTESKELENADTEPATEVVPTDEPEPTEETTTAAGLVTGVKLNADQLEEFKPNEMGMIPVLEYHTITTNEDDEEQFVRTADDFRADLEWLYERDFYVIPLRDLVLNRIAAPAGKRPVVLTFDDSTTGQFRYLVQDDGSVEIDPDSAVGIMEAFYARHPDFGRGGFFAVLPQGQFCFGWSVDGSRDDDQLPYCEQKLKWLLDNEYEIGNHTLNHTDLLKQDDGTFRAELAGAFLALKEFDSRIEPDILAMPFGNYPDLETKQQQRAWLREGFEWDGAGYKIIGCLMVGDAPTESPVSTEYDPVFIARIQAFDEDLGIDGRGSGYWFSVFENDPEFLYVSDGDPNTITVPEELPASMVGTLDTDKIEADGKELVQY